MPLTILHTESSKGWGGQENRTLNESIGLQKLGVRMIIACPPDSRLAAIGAENGIEIRTIRMEHSISLSAISSLLKIIKQERVNIVCTHSGKDSMLGAIAGRLSSRRPIIVRTRHLALPITSKITYSLLPHKVVTVSEYVRQYLIGEDIKKEKVIAVPTGIDINRFDPHKVEGNLRHKLGLKPDVPLVGTISILRYKKGHHILLDAIPLVLDKVPQAVFIFVGDGPQMENILNKIKNLKLTNKVLMLGMRNDIPEILKSIDIFVLPTLQEALGTSFIEAMAMGKPVIGSNVGGVGEVIKNGINGYLIESNNPVVLAEAIIKILKNKKAAELMGMEGRKIVERDYTIEKMCERMYALYLSLLEGRN